MQPNPSVYLRHDDFIGIRNRQDEQLSKEFRSIRDELKLESASIREELKLESASIREELKLEFASINKRFIALEAETTSIREELNGRFVALEAETKRTTAYFRNNALKNPTFRIHPVVVYDPDRGILEPEPKKFPRHAKEFYALRNPTTDNHRRMLVYLARFYDIPLNERGESSSSEGSSDDEVILLDPNHAVELLENILGLDEENFIQFRQKAQLAAQHIPTQPIKRSQIQDSEPEIKPRRRRLEIRPATTIRPVVPDDLVTEPLPTEYRADHKSSSSKSLNKDGIGWRTGTRSTPPSERQTLHGLDTQVQKAKEKARQEKAGQKEDEQEEDQSEEDQSEEGQREEDGHEDQKTLPASTILASTPSFRSFKNRRKNKDS